MTAPSNLDWTIAIAQALEETLKHFDAVPLSNDLALEYSLPSYTLKANMLHFALEEGMKEQIKNFAHTHDLAKIYLQMPRAKQELLSTAFKDAVSFYGFRVERDEWNHLTDLETYFRVTGTGDLFEDFRYWALEKDVAWLSSQIPVLFLSREMVRFISDVLTGYGRGVGGPFTVSALVERGIYETLTRNRLNNHLRRYNEDLAGWTADDKVLGEWIQGHSSWLLVLKDAYKHNFDVVNDQGNAVLHSTYKDLEATKDHHVKPAIDHALLTFRAKSSDCQVSLPANVEMYQHGRGGYVETPAGSRLGYIEERYDGLWRVNVPGKWGEIAKSKPDAVGLLVDTETRVVSVSVNEKPAQEKRAHFPRGNFSSRDGTCEFWETDHGILPGDVITLVIPPEKGNYLALQVHGTVKSVDAHTVAIAVESDILVM